MAQTGMEAQPTALELDPRVSGRGGGERGFRLRGDEGRGGGESGAGGCMGADRGAEALRGGEG